MELSKAENKIARAIIKEGMMVEFERGMRAADNILNDWRQGKGGNHQEAFHTLYRHITLFNKGIASAGPKCSFKSTFARKRLRRAARCHQVCDLTEIKYAKCLIKTKQKTPCGFTQLTGAVVW